MRNIASTLALCLLPLVSTSSHAAFDYWDNGITYLGTESNEDIYGVIFFDNKKEPNMAFIRNDTDDSERCAWGRDFNEARENPEHIKITLENMTFDAVKYCLNERQVLIYSNSDEFRYQFYDNLSFYDKRLFIRLDSRRPNQRQFTLPYRNFVDDFFLVNKQRREGNPRTLNDLAYVIDENYDNKAIISKYY